TIKLGFVRLKLVIGWGIQDKNEKSTSIEALISVDLTYFFGLYFLSLVKETDDCQRLSFNF
ncbi:hypothetical protein D3H64_04670, partial [Atopobacter sp. AH10]|uniref:hypothetical protein n=1 Tax=Atopobacter sp. AH10 TaxID=2315861 RepID=UPI000FF51C49